MARLDLRVAVHLAPPLLPEPVQQYIEYDCAHELAWSELGGDGEVGSESATPTNRTAMTEKYISAGREAGEARFGLLPRR